MQILGAGCAPPNVGAASSTEMEPGPCPPPASSPGVSQVPGLVALQCVKLHTWGVGITIGEGCQRSGVPTLCPLALCCVWLHIPLSQPPLASGCCLGFCCSGGMFLSHLPSVTKPKALLCQAGASPEPSRSPEACRTSGSASQERSLGKAFCDNPPQPGWAEPEH